VTRGQMSEIEWRIALENEKNRVAAVENLRRSRDEWMERALQAERELDGLRAQPARFSGTQ
jgi:hypothetical protein